MAMVQIPRSDGRIFGFPIPANRFDGVNLGLAVAVDDRVPDFAGTVSALRRAAKAQGTPIIGWRVMSNGEHVFGMRMPADPGQMFIQIGLRPEDVRTQRNTFDLRDRGEIISRFEAEARHYEEAGEGLFAPRELTWNLRGRAVVQRMFGRTIETPDGPLADFSLHEDGRRNDAGARAPLFGRATTLEDWSIIARSVIARIDRDEKERVTAAELRELYRAAADGSDPLVSQNDFRELIEGEMVGALAARVSQGRATAQRLSTALPDHAERDGNRLVLAQFSTPPAISQIAAEYLKPNGKVIFEPTVGNGVLAAVSAQYGGLIAGVEIDDMRAARASKALNRGDATAIISVGDAFDVESYPSNPADAAGFDAAIINPPYRKLANGDDDIPTGKITFTSLGGVTAKVSSAEALIAAQAIDQIKPGGAAVLVMPGNMIDPTRIEPKQRLTHNILNTAFEKVEALALDASLYRSMGANFPVVVYFCEGKRTADAVPTPGELPDLLPESYRLVGGYTDFYAAADQIIAASSVSVAPDDVAQANRVAFAAARSGAVPSTPAPAPQAPSATVAPEEPRGDDVAPTGGEGAPSGSRGGGRSSGTSVGRATSGDNRGRAPSASGEDTTRPVEPDRVTPEAEADPQPAPVVDAAPEKAEDELALPVNYHLLDNFDDDALTVAYSPFSAKAAGNVVIERAFESATYAALRRVVSAKGDIDRYVAGKLGFDVEHLLSDAGPLSGTQIDALGLSFFNREEKRATIVGDLMGVGKGRTMAAHAYSALIEGRNVLLMSNKPHLFRDLAVRDLMSVSGKPLREMLDDGLVKPFIMNSNSEAALTEKDGKTVVFQTTAAERNMSREKGVVNADDYNLVMSSYSQFQTAAGAWKADAITQWLVEAAQQNPDKPPVLLLDEVHEAAGPDSRTGVVMRRILDVAERYGAEIVFSSATSMKSGKNIGIYKQALPDTGLSIDQLTAVIENNPFAMQEVLSTEMARSGSIIQRKLSGAGVRRDMRLLADVDPVKLDEARDMTDRLAEFLREAVSMAGDIKAAATAQAKLRFGGAISASSVENKFKVDTVSPAASFDAISRYYLISMKSRFAHDLLRETTAAGEKATVLQEFTGDSVAEYVLAEAGYGGGAIPSEGVEVRAHPHIGHVVKRMAERMLDVKGTDALGNAVSFRVAGFDGWLDAFKDEIDRAGFEPWRVNSFDAVREACDKLGMTFEDISGRKYEFETEGEKLICRPRNIPAKMAVANRFNNGQTDVIMLTSAAATGMSLQNSPQEGVDLRTRSMIFMSFLKNIASHTQAEGRIDRTGQLTPPHYVIPNTGFVADDRLASLFNRGNRNLSSMTSGSRESERTINEAIDLLNPIGDMAVRHVLMQNPDLAETLGIPVGKDGEIEAGDLGRKLLGRAFILGAKGSQDALADVDLMAKTIIQDLEAKGENPLKLGRYDWRAKIKVIETLHDGDEANMALAEQPLQLVEIKRQEPRKVIPARDVIERMSAKLGDPKYDFETPEEALSTSTVFRHRVRSANIAGAWNFEHRLFGKLTGRIAEDDGLRREAAFEHPAPISLFTRIHDEYLKARMVYCADNDMRSSDYIGSDGFKEIVETVATRLRRWFQPLDEDGKLDRADADARMLRASSDDKEIFAFLTRTEEKGKNKGSLARDVENLERAVRVTVQRTEAVAAFMAFADHIEPGRLVALNVNAVDGLVAGRFGELSKQAELPPELSRWVPAVIVDADIDYTRPTALSHSSIKVFVPGETGVFTMSLSEMRSNMSFRGDREPALGQFRLFASQVSSMSYNDAAAPVLAEYVGKENVETFTTLMNNYARDHARPDQEVNAARVVDRMGREGEGAALLRTISEMLPRGSVTRTRYGLTGNLFTAMAAVTGATARDKNLGEKAVVTDDAGNSVNVILLNEAGQKQAIERVKQKEKSRSHPRPELRGNTAAIQAEMELVTLVLKEGTRARGWQRSESRELDYDSSERLATALATLHPKTLGSDEAREHVRRNAGAVLGGIMDRLQSDQSYPASIVIGADLWRDMAEERARAEKEAKRSGARAGAFDAPAVYTVGKKNEGFPSIDRSLSALSVARGVSSISDDQLVVMLHDDKIEVLFRKNNALASGSEFRDLVKQSRDTISLEGKPSKLTRGVLNFEASLWDAEKVAKLADFVGAVSAASESAPLSGGFARNIHAAVLAEQAEVAKALRQQKERQRGVERDQEPSAEDGLSGPSAHHSLAGPVA